MEAALGRAVCTQGSVPTNGVPHTPARGDGRPILGATRKRKTSVLDTHEPISFASLLNGRVAYGGPRARDPIGAVAAGLHHSHSNAGSEPHLWPTPQLTSVADP